MAAYRRRNHTSTNTSSSRPSSISIPTYSYDDDDADADADADTDRSNPTSLAAKAIRASSAAHSSLSSAYAVNHPSPSSSSASSIPPTTVSSASSNAYQYTSIKTLNESKQGFWGSLARKAKSILEDDNAPAPQPQHSPPPKPKYHYDHNPYPSRDTHHRKTDSPKLQKGLNAISSSLNYIGNAVEEGLTIVENRTADIIQETRKHIRKNPSGASAQNQASHRSGMQQQPQIQTHRQAQIETDQELQLKASRDVAMAMAAKAKLLLRELKTVKADLAFAKERCAQLEEENKILRDNCERGESLEDDDLIRLQLETLLAEKARLAHENSTYARENRFLREVVEYHQLTMQDVVYLDEGTEEVTEVYPIKVVSNTHSTPAASMSPSLCDEASLNTSLRVNQDILPHPAPPRGLVELSQSAAPPSSYTPTSMGVDTKKYSTLL